LSASHTVPPAEAFPTLKKAAISKAGQPVYVPPGNGCFGTPVYSLVYIFAGEAIFQARKKPVSYML